MRRGSGLAGTGSISEARILAWIRGWVGLHQDDPPLPQSRFFWLTQR